MDLTTSEYSRLHDSAFSDMEFASDILADRSVRPAHETWNEFATHFPPGPLLEIGPGTGHFLAAAQHAHRDVFAVEASAVHRDFILRTWGIRNVVASIEDLPDSPPQFGTVVMFNTIEHVFDVAGLFASIRSRLRPGGVVLVSTCNADCVILPLVRTYWSMFKIPDHVSIASGDGFRRLATRTGFRCLKVWTGELPLETPIGIAVALRDWVRERQLGEAREATVIVREAGQAAPTSPSPAPLQRRLMRGAVRLTKRIDPTRYLTSRLGRAATVRAVFERD